MPVIYIDVLLALNLWIDFILLLATARILRGVPVYGGAVRGELCTPTGAALLKHFVSAFGGLPPPPRRSSWRRPASFSWWPFPGGAGCCT